MSKEDGAQKLCEEGGKAQDLCEQGRQLRSCVEVEVAVLGRLPVLIGLYGLCGGKATLNFNLRLLFCGREGRFKPPRWAR